MFSNDDNNFAGAAFGYPIQGNDNSDPNCYHFEETSGCPFEVTNCYPIEATGGCPIGVTDGVPFACAALTSGLDLGPLTDFSTSELEQWCMSPEFGSQMDFFSDAAGFNIDDAYNFCAFGQQPAYAPECAGSSMTGPSTVQSHYDFPATLFGPGSTSAEVPADMWDPPPLAPALYVEPGSYLLDPYGLPPSVLDVGSQLLDPDRQPPQSPTLPVESSSPTSADKGKARATDQLPSTGNRMWKWEKPYKPRGDDVGLNLQTGAGVQNTALSTQAGPSTGPHRSAKRAKGKVKEEDKGEGKRRYAPHLKGVDWHDTCERFSDEAARICFDQPTGEVVHPETAYAEIIEFIKEDLRLPLAEQRSRHIDQYLTRILHVLYPAPGDPEGRRSAQDLFERVAEKLERELDPVNGGPALMDGKLKPVDPGVVVKAKSQDKERWDGNRRALGRMSRFFRVPRPDFQGWSRPQLIFFAIVYLKFGVRTFGDETRFIVPKSQP